MKFIIVGVGKVGQTLVKNLIEEGHDIVVVDIDSEAVSNAVDKFDVKGYVGGGLEKEVLSQAEVNGTDFFIACTSHDEVNILACVLAKKLGAKMTIARIRDPRYYAELGSLKENLGLDLAFNPEKRAAMDIDQILQFPSAKSIDTFANGRASMVEFEIAEGNPLVGKALKELFKDYGNRILFGMAKRGEKIIIPKGDFVIEEKDDIYIIGSETELSLFLKRLKIFKPRAKSVFIVGGGKIAYYLAEILIKKGVSVKILEKDKERCASLASDIPEATVIYGDGTDQDVLKEEDLKGFDACVTLTGKDEENVMISLFAKQSEVDKVITKVVRPSILNMVKNLGLDSIISPRDSIANHILKFVRLHQSENLAAGIKSLYKLNDTAEVVEFNVNEDFINVGKKLKDIKLKGNLLIGGIVRDKEFIVPTGESTLEIRDKVIIITTSKQINELSEILR